MATLRRQTGRQGQLRLAPGIDVSGLAAAANVQRLRVQDNRALDAFATQVQDFAFERGALRREAEGEADAPTTFERKLIESKLNINGEIRVIRDEAGAVAPVLPARNSLSIYDQAYRKATLARYGEQIYRDARGTIGRLAQENRLDPKSFSDLTDQYIASVSESALPDARQYVTQQLRSLQSGHFSRIEAQKASTDYKNTVNDLTVAVDESVKDLSNMVASGASLTYLEAGSDGNPKVRVNEDFAAAYTRTAQSLSHLNEIGQISDAQMGEAFTSVNQQLARAHMMSAVRGIPGTEAGEVQLMKAVRSFLSGKSNVELPTIDEDGNMRVLLQNSSTLWEPPERTQVANALVSYWKAHSELDRVRKDISDRITDEKVARVLISSLASAREGEDPTAAQLQEIQRLTAEDPRMQLAAMRSFNEASNIARATRNRVAGESLDRLAISNFETMFSQMSDTQQVSFQSGISGEMIQFVRGADPAADINVRAQVAGALVTRGTSWLKVMERQQADRLEILNAAENHALGGSARVPEENEFATSSSMFETFAMQRSPELVGGDGIVPPQFYLDDENFAAVRQAIRQDNGLLGKMTRYAPPRQIGNYLAQVMAMSDDTPGVQQHRRNAIQLRKDLRAMPGTAANMATSKFMSDTLRDSYRVLDSDLKAGNPPDVDSTWERARKRQVGLDVDQDKDIFLSSSQKNMITDITARVANDGQAITQPQLELLVNAVRRRMPTTGIDEDVVEQVATEELRNLMRAGHMAPSELMAPHEGRRSEQPQLAAFAPSAIYGMNESFFAGVLSPTVRLLNENPRFSNEVGQELVLGKNLFLAADFSAQFDRPEDIKYRMMYIGLNASRMIMIPDLSPGGDPNRLMSVDFKPHVMRALNDRIHFAGISPEFRATETEALFRDLSRTQDLSP